MPSIRHNTVIASTLSTPDPCDMSGCGWEWRATSASFVSYFAPRATSKTVDLVSELCSLDNEHEKVTIRDSWSKSSTRASEQINTALITMPRHMKMMTLRRQAYSRRCSKRTSCKIIHFLQSGAQTCSIAVQ